MVNRKTRRGMLETLPEDMAFLKAKVKELSEHTGLPEEETPAAEEDPKEESSDDKPEGATTEEEETA